MIELSDTPFQCHLCGTHVNVSNIVFVQEKPNFYGFNVMRTSIRLCGNCRKRVKQEI
jgi:hypothetical protein